MRGVKGRSSLLDLDEFDPVTMTLVEVMHTFDLGIIKYFLQLWTCQKKKVPTNEIEKPWVLNSQQLHEWRIDSIRVPHHITRKPKFDNRDGWKADGMFLT